ncbi:MAG: guanylate kinase [Lachnospira sp.]|nr:guanylate kinase [Lachnospira sp.]
MSKQGKLLVVSGFSGAGKGTVMKKLLETYDNYNLSISATTRKPREGEVDGREYFFKTVDEFKAMIEADEFLEHAQYVGNYYGTPKGYVISQMEAGNNCMLEIEIVGAMNVKRLIPEAKLIFVTPPSATELKSRLVGRGTEDEATIMARLARAIEESDGVENYDYIVLNDTVEECVQMIDKLVHDDEEACNICKATDNLDLIYQIREDLKKLSEGK